MTAALPLDRADAAWLAGLLDGEGCFDAPRGNPRIRVRMTDFDVILRAATLMDASTYGEVDRRPTRVGGLPKPLLCAQTTGQKALAVMRTVLPYMGSRRSAKITELIMADAERHGRKPLRTVVAAPLEAAA